MPDDNLTDVQPRVQQEMKAFSPGFTKENRDGELLLVYRHADVEALVSRLLAESDTRVSTLLSTLQKELKDSYARYNNLMTRILDVVNHDYTSMYAIKRAILDSLSESLHEVKDDAK